MINIWSCIVLVFLSSAVRILSDASGETSTHRPVQAVEYSDEYSTKSAVQNDKSPEVVNDLTGTAESSVDDISGTNKDTGGTVYCSSIDFAWCPTFKAVLILQVEGKILEIFS